MVIPLTRRESTFSGMITLSHANDLSRERSMKKFQLRFQVPKLVATVVGSAVLVLGGATFASADTQWDAVSTSPAPTETVVPQDTKWD